MKRKKWRRYIRSKGLEPQMNRRKFGSILFGTTIVVFFLFIVRFGYIVTVGTVGSKNTSLNAKTQQLYQGSQVVKAKRGAIYDRNGVLIAGDATSYSVYAVIDKEYLGVYNNKTKEKEKLYVEQEQKEQVAQVLKKYLNVKPDYALKQMNQKKNVDGLPVRQVEFNKEGKGISLEVKTQIEEELAKDEINGVYFTEHPARINPNGVFSPYLVGYTKLVDDTNEAMGLTGMAGVEAAYNKELSGTDGLIHFQKDNMQQPLPGTIVADKKAIDGTDIYLTLDSQLQSRLEDLVQEVFDDYKPEDITATLVEAKTGNILAATQRPAFNPETLEGLEGQWQNLLVALPFEPGSTMKIFTVAAAIETGNFNPNATFATGNIQVDDKKINDHIREGIGTITYRQALAWSSNVGMVHLQRAMDMKWIDYLKRFGFGQSTESGLPTEEPGNILTGTTVDRAMTSYGQGMGVTPFQMIQGFTAFTNEGAMLKPNIISKKVKADGNEVKIEPEVVGKPITASTANQVLDMMTDVVEDEQFGTGQAYKLDGYRVAAKTGTSEIYDTSVGGYLTDQYLFSVVQMAPAENPEYIVYVTVRKPPVGTVATEMIAKISNAILERALNVDTAVETD